MVLTDLPPHIQTLADAFASELKVALGEHLLGLFLYGDAMFPPAAVTDFDYHVIVDRELDEVTKQRARDIDKTIAGVPGGDDMDGYYVTLDAVSKPDHPAHQLWDGVFDRSWALHRAHVLAGRYVVACGVDPRDLLAEPTWAELDEALQGELEFVDEHMKNGTSTAYCLLNTCRILSSYSNRDVVLSKLDGATWAFAALPAEHHGMIRTSLKQYATHVFEDFDAKELYEEMLPRIEKARAS